MPKYKLYLDDGDDAITKRTAQRYGLKDVGVQTDDEIDKIDAAQIFITNPIEDMELEYQSTPMDTSDQCGGLNEQINDMKDGTWDADYRELFEEFFEDIKTNKYPDNLKDFLNSPDFFEKVKTPVDKSKGEIFWMIVKFSLLNSLPMSALTNLFKMINAIFETPVLPDSRYITEKILNPKTGIQFHAVCHNCSKYFGKFTDIDKSKTMCDNCNVEVNLQNPSNTSYFVLIDPTTQISDLINQHENYYNFVVNERKYEKGFLKDVYDGKVYRNFVKSLPIHEKRNFVTAVFNTDGAQKFKCSQYSIWPIFLKINELPRDDRMNNLVTCGLFFHKNKPDMRILIDKFVDLINDITEKGISSNILGEQRLLKLHILSCSVDSVARAPIQGLKQFNGTYGCTWCLHPGKYAAGSMRYTILSYNVPDRNPQETVELMIKAAEEKKIIDGIKYPSPLINLSSFDIVWGFTPDYLHCCLEGVADQFLKYYLEPLSTDEITKLDTIMNKISVPQQVSRLCRPISTVNDWKARELENFVLFYSVILLAQILPKNKLDHWMLFVQSLYIILKDEIHINELNDADEMLHKFVGETEALYGDRAMTFNLHQMLHICKSISYHGPAWTNSTFCFETANFYLLRAIQCSKGVTQQVVRFVNINYSLLLIEQRVRPQASDSIVTFCDDILGMKTRYINRSSDIVYFGKEDEVDERDIQAFNLSSNVFMYLKMVKTKCLYESHTKEKRRSNNSFAKLINGQYIRIVGFIVDHGKNLEITICNIVHTRTINSLYKQMKIVKEIEATDTVVFTKDIERVCVFINVRNDMYLCAVPNMLHY